MKSVSRFGSSLYGLALIASFVGASMLLSGFLIAANWNYGNHVAMVIYFLISSLGTLGLAVATALFWSDNPVAIRIGLISNAGTLLFSSLLAAALLLDKHPDPSPMVVGLSRSMSLSISTFAWVAVPVVSSLIGTLASLWRRSEAKRHAGISLPQGSSAYLSG